MVEWVWGADAIDAQAADVPRGVPVLWYYDTGTTNNPEILWEAADVAMFPHSQKYRVDQGFGDQMAPGRPFDADEYDMEAQAWTPEGVARVIRLRNERHWSTRVYASVDPWNALLTILGREGIGARSVFWREANWNFTEQEAASLLGGQRYAIQYAAPSVKPDLLVPGTDLTLAGTQLDLNVIRLASTGWQG